MLRELPDDDGYLVEQEGQIILRVRPLAGEPNKRALDVHTRAGLVAGPMVINERTDYFDSPRLKQRHGVGVFLIKDGKIVEWSDFTIDRVTA